MGVGGVPLRRPAARSLCASLFPTLIKEERLVYFVALKAGERGGEMRRAWSLSTETRSGANGPLTGKGCFDVSGRREKRKNIRRAGEETEGGRQNHKTSCSPTPQTLRSASW